VVWAFSRPNLASPLQVLFQFELSSGIKFSTSVLYVIRSTQRVLGDGLGHPIARTGCHWGGARTPIAVRTTASEFSPVAPARESASVGLVSSCGQQPRQRSGSCAPRWLTSTASQEDQTRVQSTKPCMEANSHVCMYHTCKTINQLASNQVHIRIYKIQSARVILHASKVLIRSRRPCLYLARSWSGADGRVSTSLITMSLTGHLAEDPQWRLSASMCSPAAQRPYLRCAMPSPTSQSGSGSRSQGRMIYIGLHIREYIIHLYIFNMHGCRKHKLARRLADKLSPLPLILF
jgi:hypothetical protein